MKIPKETVDKVLAVYYPNYKYLKEADIEYPIGKGKFLIEKTGYMETLQHMTDVEAQLCLNQLCYVFFGQGVIDKKWKGLENLSFDEYLDLRKENMFITESHKKFKRETNPKEPFYGQIEVMNIKSKNNLYVTKLNFSLNDSLPALKGRGISIV